MKRYLQQLCCPLRCIRSGTTHPGANWCALLGLNDGEPEQPGCSSTASECLSLTYGLLQQAHRSVLTTTTLHMCLQIYQPPEVVAAGHGCSVAAEPSRWCAERARHRC